MQKLLKTYFAISELSINFNVLVSAKEEFKEEMKIKKKLVKGINHNSILESSIHSNKLTHRVRIKHNKFANALNRGLENRLSVHGRKHDAKVCNSKKVLTNAAIKDFRNILLADEFTLY